MESHRNNAPLVANGHYRDNQHGDIPTTLHATIDLVVVQLYEVQQRLNRDSLSNLVVSNESPFISKIMAIPLIGKFKMPSMSSYNGNKDLLEHLEDFKDWLGL